MLAASVHSSVDCLSPYLFSSLVLGSVNMGKRWRWREYKLVAGRDRWDLELWDMHKQIQKESREVINHSITLLFDKSYVGDIEYGL